MLMFKKGKTGGNVNTKDVETIIGSSVKVEGDFVCQGNMVIDGEVKGNVTTKGMLRVGNKAIIVADIAAASAKISGQIRGNVVVDDYLEVAKTARIFGDIKASRLSVAEGALLNGGCVMPVKEGKQTKAIKATTKTVKEETEEPKE